MPAQDRYHGALLKALHKEGWRNFAEQVTIWVANRHMWIDIYAENPQQQLAILIELKTFENMASPFEYLAHAMGKYNLYRAAIELLELSLPLYLAVPVAAHAGILSEEIGQMLLAYNDAKLIVFDPIDAEITQWIH